MKKPLIIFGTGDIAQLAHFYFNSDSNFQVVAFTVDAAYLTNAEFCGLPVIAFEKIGEQYAPDKYQIFIALSYSKLNAIRKEKYLSAKASGYQFATRHRFKRRENRRELFHLRRQHYSTLRHHRQ